MMNPILFPTLLAVGENFTPGFANQNEWLRLVFIQWPITLAPALFTWLLPALLRYRRGGMAWIGAAVAIFFTVVLPLSMAAPVIRTGYEHLHPWLYGVFYLYACAGVALCAVGIYDRKRSAWWAMAAVSSLVGGAIIDTLIWLGLMHGEPAVPWGFIGFWAFLAIGWLRRPADPSAVFDLVNAAKILANNRTRRARSISRKLLREGQLHFLPVYYLAMLSDMAREGVMNSGSYRFADHIYRLEPSGRGALGRWIDGVFLRLPATRAFHLRYKRAQTAIRTALESFPVSENPLRVLAIPCGLPRDLTELAATLAQENPSLLARIEYHGMDIDPELLKLADAFTANCGVPRRIFHRGNALLAADYPPSGFHAIVSTGLGEFLQTPELEILYRNVHAALAPGGTFYTSATRYEKRSEAFLRAFELITQYRTTEDLEKILAQLPWSRLTCVQDNSGLQTFVVAVK
jgi:SAM-dependent methyltransferase